MRREQWPGGETGTGSHPFPLTAKTNVLPKLSERHIQNTCSEWLVLDGWRRVRTDPAQLRGLGVSEPGMADDLFIRYDPVSACEFCPDHRGHCTNCRATAYVLWVEWKRQTGGSGKRALFTKAEKAKIRQRGWIEAERTCGALVWLAGEDFPASIEGFQQHYIKSGLSRKWR